jgi:hypothetical protein
MRRSDIPGTCVHSFLLESISCHCTTKRCHWILLLYILWDVDARRDNQVTMSV